MEFQKEVKFDKWLKPIEGILIAKTAECDAIVLGDDRRVVRISHEDYEIKKMWRNIESFVYDAIEFLD